jgi:hypothetical protein
MLAESRPVVTLVPQIINKNDDTEGNHDRDDDECGRPAAIPLLILPAETILVRRVIFFRHRVAIVLAANDLSWNRRDPPHICVFRKLAFLRIQRRRGKWQLTTSPARSPHE